MAKRDPLYDAYLKARARAWRDNNVRLTEREFMSTIDPHREYSDDAARLYIRNLREGKWSSQNALQRSRETEGQIFNILLKDESGVVVDSVNIELPLEQNIWDAYRSGDLEAGLEEAMEKRYQDRTAEARRRGLKLRQNQWDEEELDELDYETPEMAKEEIRKMESIGRRSLKGLTIAGAKLLMPGHVHTPTQVIHTKRR